MAEEETWDIVRDLHFLIASDDQLQNELSHVCDLLNAPEEELFHVETPFDSTTSEDSESIPTNSPPSKKETKRTKRKSTTGSTTVRFETRQKEEILQLQEQVNALKKQLELSTAKGAKKIAGISAWEKAARRELAEKNKAIRENEHLRGALHEQTTFIEYMQSIFAKKPRLSNIPDSTSNAWQECKLAAQSSLRAAAIHAIADRQYSKQQNAFINAGIFEREENLFRGGTRFLPEGRPILEFVYHLNLPAPYEVVGDACWQVYNGERPPTLAPGASNSMEVLDESTVYIKYTECSQVDGSMTYANLIHKRYIDEDHQVIVWRAVLEDALMPSMATGTVGNEWGWIVISPVPENPGHCRLSLLGQIPKTPEAPPIQECPVGTDEMLAEITAFVDKLSLSKGPEELQLEQTKSATRNTTDECKADSELDFMNRGKRLEKALQIAVTAAVISYRAKHPC